MIFYKNDPFLIQFLSHVCPSPHSSSKAAQSQQAEYPSIISCFPQMKPEAQAKAPALSKQEEYLAIGVPAEWVAPLQALGYTTIDKIKALEKPGKLHQEMMGYRKKNKLEIGTVTMEDVNSWIS
jgi:hypothetical protein